MFKLNRLGIESLDEYGHLDDQTLLDSLEALHRWCKMVDDGHISIAEFVIMISRDESIHWDLKHKVVRGLLREGV